MESKKKSTASGKEIYSIQALVEILRKKSKKVITADGIDYIISILKSLTDQILQYVIMPIISSLNQWSLKNFLQ